MTSEAGLQLLNKLAAEGQLQFTAQQAEARLARSPTSTSNLLRRLVRDGLIERVRHGRYAIRHLGMLGTAVAAEDVLLAVAAGFPDTAHRVAYRSALDHLELLVHPSRVIQVALTKPTRSETLSNRPLTTVIEPEDALAIGAERRGAPGSRTASERCSTLQRDRSSSVGSRSWPRRFPPRRRSSIQIA